MANYCSPFYDPGSDLSAVVTRVGGVVGCTFATIDATGTGRPASAISDVSAGGRVPATNPAAGGDTFGVFGYNAAQGAGVKIVRGAGKVVPVFAAAALAAGDEVETDANGRAIPLDTGKARGRCWQDAANGTLAMIELYP
jgi:hypothetical protein